MILVAAFALVLAAGAAYGQPSPIPLGPGGSCPYGWAGVGSYCQPPQGAQGAVPIGPGGSCPPGWAAVGSYCQQPADLSPTRRGAQGAVPVPIGPGGSCPPGLGGGRLVLSATAGCAGRGPPRAWRQLSPGLGGGRLVLPAAGRFVPSAVETREYYAGALVEQEARRQGTPAN